MTKKFSKSQKLTGNLSSMILSASHCHKFILIKKLFMTLKLKSIFAQFWTFMKVSMKLKPNNLLSSSLLKFLNLGVLSFTPMTLSSLSVGGRKETKKILFLTLLMNTLSILTFQSSSKFIVTLKWVQENLPNKQISAMKNLLIFHFAMLTNYQK